MRYLNLDLGKLKGEKFAVSDLEEIGTWLLLSAYCATVENAGVIKGAKKWSDRQWIATPSQER